MTEDEFKTVVEGFRAVAALYNTASTTTTPAAGAGRRLKTSVDLSKPSRSDSMICREDLMNLRANEGENVTGDDTDGKSMSSQMWSRDGQKSEEVTCDECVEIDPAELNEVLGRTFNGFLDPPAELLAEVYTSVPQ